MVRKRPHGEDVAGKPILLEPFPRVGESLCDTKEVVDYMKKEMEERFGGAHEDTDLVYKSPEREGVRGKSKARGSVHAGRTGGYSRQATSSSLSDAYPLEFSRLRYRVLRQALLAHLRRERGAQRSGERRVPDADLRSQEYVMKGKDAYGNPIMLPPDPSVLDEMERTKTIIYNLTPVALEYFQMRVGTLEGGDPKHLRVIEKLLKQEYWPKGYFSWSTGAREEAGEADIAVLKPRTREIKDKDGNELRMPDPYYWDYSTPGGRGGDGPAEEQGAGPEELPQERGGLRLDQVRRDLGHNAKQLQEILSED